MPSVTKLARCTFPGAKSPAHEEAASGTILRSPREGSDHRRAVWSAAWILAAIAIPGAALAQAPARKKPPQAVTPAPSASAAPAASAPKKEGITLTPRTKPPQRWTAATPDEMVDQAFARARRDGDDALAALVVASSLDERASFGKVRDGLKAIASSGSPLADEARWLALRLTPSPPSPAWAGMRAVSYDAPPDPDGLAKSFAILGPFQDTTGEGLMRREGPEAPGGSWSDSSARFSWGVYEVAWRRTLPASATARGLPLDLYIHPRSESCTYLATRVTVPAGTHAMLAHVAASGAVRLIWDGADVAASDDIHPRLVLDRITARIEPTSGDHLVALKVCTGAVGDEGRVRLRFTDERHAPLPLATSSDLASLKITAPAHPATATASPKKKGGEPAAARPKVALKPRPAPEPKGVAPSPGKQAAAPSKPPAPPKDAAPPHDGAASGPKAPPEGVAGSAKPPQDGAAGGLKPKLPPGDGLKLAAVKTPAKGAPNVDKGQAEPKPNKPGATPPPVPAPVPPDAEALLDAAPIEEPPSKVAITPPTGVTVIRTPLEKGIDLSGAPASIDRVLAASILRTLGGADDARSPRAPGLLDRVADAARVPADGLAMAGWVSPFGSNRSGWLNLARTRAAAEHDAGAAAFAQRRLAASHLSSHFVDWAFSTINEEPLRSANDTEAKLIRAMAKRKLASSGLTRSSVEDLSAIEADLKDKTPIGVLSELLDAARGQRDIEIRVARRLAEIHAESRSVGYVRSFRNDGAAALETAAATSLAQQTSADELLGIGHELIDAGRYAWAREIFYLATQLAPNRSAGFQGLAAARQALGAIETKGNKPPSEDPALAQLDLLRARDLEPGDAALKAEIAFRSDSGGGDTPNHQVMRDEEYLVPPATFLARAKQNPAKKGAVVDRQLHWIRVVTYHPDKRISQLMHYSREIVVEPRTENELYENLPIEGDDNELLVARVHRKDGTVAMPEEQGSGGRQPYVRWPDLKTGDVVEVAIRSWTAGPVGRRGDAPFYFIDYVGSTDTHPVLFNEVVVDSPQGSPLAIDVLNGKPDRIVPAQKEGRTITRYVWDNPPTIADEPLAPRQSESMPVVVGSTFSSWGDFREWYRGAVSGFTVPDDQVRRLAEELTKGKKTPDEKLKAIFEFVADDIRYVNYVSGEWWLPNRPQELLARRQGDCDDKAMLLITLLKSIGIEANEVLVQTRYTAEPSLLRSEKAAIPKFDHGIAYLPGKNGAPGIWLDATSPESRLGPLPSMDARAVALFVDEGQAKIIDTPASSPVDHGTDADWTIKLSPSGAGELTASELHTGDSAFELRMNLKQADARSQWVEQYLASGWFPTVQVKGDVDFKPDLPKGTASLRYGAQSDGFARREGSELAVPIAEASTLTSQLAPLVKRTLPVVLPPRLAPGHTSHTITIIAPPGYSFADLPPGGDEAGGEFGKAHLEFSKAAGKNAVVVKRSVTFDMSTIPVDKYARWRAWLQRVDGLMHRMVRLVPDDKGASAPAKALASGKAGNSSNKR